MENNAIQIFNYKEQELRTTEKNGEIWFVAKDVADILEISNVSKAVQGLDEDEKGITKSYTLRGMQDMTIISEAGLYTLLMRSNKPEAKPFRRWVTHEVLPSIRKTGAYAVNGNIQSQLNKLKNENALLHEKVDSLIAQIEAERSFAVLGKVVSLQSGIISFSEAAKILSQNGAKTGPNKLLKKGRETGLLCKCKGRRWNQPTQKAINDGLAVLVINFGDKGTAFLTSKGLQKISDEFIGQIYPLLSLIERGDVANA